MEKQFSEYVCGEQTFVEDGAVSLSQYLANWPRAAESGVKEKKVAERLAGCSAEEPVNFDRSALIYSSAIHRTCC